MHDPKQRRVRRADHHAIVGGECATGTERALVGLAGQRDDRYGLCAGKQRGSERPGASDWFPKLMTDPAFVAALTARWKVLRQGLLSEAAIEQRIQALTAPLQQAAARDLQRWPVAQVFSNAQQYSGPTASDWQGQVDAIREWIPKRLAWMDTQFP